MNVSHEAGNPRARDHAILTNMTGNSERSPRLRASRHLLGGLLVLAALLLGLSGCGIGFGDGSPETEIFQELSVEGAAGGPLKAGETLTIKLDYEQPYPVTVRIECNLLAGDDGTSVLATPTPEGPYWSHDARAGKVLTILPVKALEANPEEHVPKTVDKSFVDEVTPVAGSLEQSFRAPDLPGDYVVECFTQQDDNNFIRELITIAPAPEATSTPGPVTNDTALGGS